MDKMLVVVFDSELKAYEGSRALQELQNEGSINLYAKAVIARDASGKVTVKQQGDMGPVGTAVGLLTGSLIGLIGGPVGLAIGANAGMFGGMLYDLANLGVGEDFLDRGRRIPAAGQGSRRSRSLGGVDAAGRYAHGGPGRRRLPPHAMKSWTAIERDVAALKAELAELEAEYDQATGEAKAKLQAKIDAAKAKLQATQDAIQARIEASQKETEAKIKSLQEQAAKESGERKAKREARIAELKADQKRRSDLLKQAWELTKEALSA